MWSNSDFGFWILDCQTQAESALLNSVILTKNNRIQTQGFIYGKEKCRGRPMCLPAS
jgi:hypothetical protein